MLAIARAKFLTGKIDLFVTFTTACNYDCAFCNRDVDKAMIRLKDVARVDALARHARYVDITGTASRRCIPNSTISSVTSRHAACRSGS